MIYGISSQCVLMKCERISVLLEGLRCYNEPLKISYSCPRNHMKIKLIIVLLVFVPAWVFAQTNISSKVEGGKPQAVGNQEKVGSTKTNSYCVDTQCTNVSSERPATASSPPVPQGSAIIGPTSEGLSKGHPNAP